MNALSKAAPMSLHELDEFFSYQKGSTTQPATNVTQPTQPTTAETL